MIEIDIIDSGLDHNRVNARALVVECEFKLNRIVRGLFLLSDTIHVNMIRAVAEEINDG